MCEKQETFGEWSVSVGRENVKVSNGKVSKCICMCLCSNIFFKAERMATCQSGATGVADGHMSKRSDRRSDRRSDCVANCLVNHTEQIADIDVVSVVCCVVGVKFEFAYFEVVAE